jgi:hypothetical protein
MKPSHLVKRAALTCSVIFFALAAGSPAAAQFDPSDLDPFNRDSKIRKGGEDLGNRIGEAASKLDPVVAAKRELENARAAVMKDLRKFDPQEIFDRVQLAIEKRVGHELTKAGVAYDNRSGTIDLRKTAMGSILGQWLSTFAQGNKGESKVEEFTFNVRTRQLTVRLYARHCQSWGKVIPGQGPVDLYSITQRATFRYNFKSGEGMFDIDLGKLAPRINSKTLKRLAEGDLVAVAEALAPEAIGQLMHYERQNNYDARVADYRSRYGQANVYFASKKFVDWATPETIGKYVINGVLSGGASVYPQIMRDARERAMEEMPPLTDWLQRCGMANASLVARQLLTGETPRWPFIKFEMIPVRYSAREKPLAAMSTPWRHVDHLAFVIVWLKGGGPGTGSGSLGGTSNKPGAKTIRLSFTNETGARVHFVLKGGQEPGQATSLGPRETGSFIVPIEPRKTANVVIAQTHGKSLSFSISDGGKYALRMKDGKIQNFYR